MSTTRSGRFRFPDPGPHRELVRRVAAVTVVMSVLSLAGMAIISSRARPASSVAEVRERPARAEVAAPAPEPPDGARPGTLAPLSLSTFDRRATPVPGAAPSVAAPPPTAGSSGPPTLPAPAPQAPTSEAAACPALGLPAPTETGGIASVIAIVPLFGPFSAEAFAMLPAFEPALPVIGPLFPPAERALTSLAPLLAVVTPGAQTLGQAGFDLLAPFYGPRREAVLDAETDLAAAIAPAVEALATAPRVECVVALEGVLTALLA